METNKEEQINITLPPDLGNALTEAAERQGTTPERLALDCLRERFVTQKEIPSLEGERASLADFLADHIGVLSSSEHVPGGARMSEDTGRKFAAGLLAKRQQKRL